MSSKEDKKCPSKPPDVPPPPEKCKKPEVPPPPLCDENLLVTMPPPYSELGKDARDIFDKGFHFGLIKLNMKTKSKSGVEFSAGCLSMEEGGVVTGTLETKYKAEDYGMVFAEKWTTDNTLGTEITIEDQLVQGLKIGTSFMFSPQSGEKTWFTKFGYGDKRVNLSGRTDGDPNATLIQGDAVVSVQGWLAGYQAVFDYDNKKLTKNNFALGFAKGDVVLHTNVNMAEDEESPGKKYTGSIYQKVTTKLSTGLQMEWSSSNAETKFGIGAKYDLDTDASLRAKINNVTEIGLGYQQRLRDGIIMTLSTLINGKNITEGPHKIGLAIELEA